MSHHDLPAGHFLYGRPKGNPMPATTPAESGASMPPVLTVPQTAGLLRWSLRSTYRAVEADAIPHLRIGRRIAIPTAKLLDQLGIPLDGIDWQIE